MTVTFRPARRENVPLLIGVAGGTGSGKTMSALLLARGIAQGAPFAFVDTENGRGLHYAEAFSEMQHGDLRAPFRPASYTAAIQDGFQHLADVPKDRRVVVVDSFSHEWTGDGGCLDWVDEITGGDPKKKGVAWATVKPAHRRMMTKLLGLDAHVIVCLRAEYGKVDIVRKDGKTEFVPKRTLPGGSLNDWYPESEKAFPYELTASFLVVADAPGVPRPLKLQEQHKPFVPLDRPLTEEVGRALAEWARGGASEPTTGLSKAQFAAKLNEAGITPDRVRETGARLFPGKAAKDLTDSERADLLAALKDSAADAQTVGGPPGAAMPAPAAADQDEATPTQAGAEQPEDSPSPTDGPAPVASSEPEPGSFVPPPGADKSPDNKAANEAAVFVIPVGSHKGTTIGEMGATDEGLEWIKWALRNYHSDPLKSQVWAWAKVFAPDLHDEVLAQREVVSA